MENLISINGIILSTIKSYTVKSIGKKAEIVDFVYDNESYIKVSGDSNKYKEISISGNATTTVCSSLKSLCEAGSEVSISDLYGVGYNNCIISNISLDFIGAINAQSYSITIIIPSASSNIFKAGGTYTYGIESCTINDRGNRSESITSIDGSILYLPKDYSDSLFDIQIDGTELISNKFSDEFGNGITTFITPDLNEYSVIATNKSISLIQGTSSFQKFSVSMIASKTTFQGITNYVIESYTITNRHNNMDIIYNIDGSSKVIIKQYVTNLVDIEVTGIEKDSTFTNTLIDIFTFKIEDNDYNCILVLKNITPIPGVDAVQRFSVNFIGTLDTLSEMSNFLVESYTITDNSARYSKHRTIGGLIIQKFSRVSELEISANLLVTNISNIVVGNNLSIDGYTGLVTGASFSTVEGYGMNRKASINMIVLS